MRPDTIRFGVRRTGVLYVLRRLKLVSGNPENQNEKEWLRCKMKKQ